MVLQLASNADGTRPLLLPEDPSSYEDRDILTYDEAMASKSPQPYITAEINASAFTEDLAVFIVGRPDQKLNDRSETYKNGPLSPNTYYAVFLRAFWSVSPQVKIIIPVHVYIVCIRPKKTILCRPNETTVTAYRVLGVITLKV